MSERPIVLDFVTDRRRWDACGCYRANPPGRSPELARTAARWRRRGKPPGLSPAPRADAGD